MIRFPYILNVKYPYGTQHYYSITLSWCCVHVEIRVDVGSDITSHYWSIYKSARSTVSVRMNRGSERRDDRHSLVIGG